MQKRSECNDQEMRASQRTYESTPKSIEVTNKMFLNPTFNIASVKIGQELFEHLFTIRLSALKSP